MVIDIIHRVSTLFCCFMEVKPMAGKLCPNCKQFTFFKTVGENRECTKCGYKMVVPIQSKGRGERCPNCGKLTVQKSRWKEVLHKLRRNLQRRKKWLNPKLQCRMT